MLFFLIALKAASAEESPVLQRSSMRVQKWVLAHGLHSVLRVCARISAAFPHARCLQDKNAFLILLTTGNAGVLLALETQYFFKM